LSWLSLVGTDDSDGSFTRALADSCARGLRTLCFVASTASDLTPATSRILNLRPFGPAHPVGPAFEAGLAALANSPFLPALRHLDLADAA